MKKLFLLGIISVGSLVILRQFGIRTEILMVDAWVDSLMAIFTV
jgi:hypothetical protein